MKLPKLPAQWDNLNAHEKQRIDEVSDLATMILFKAGYESPQELDENAEEIGDITQSLLMDALLRAPLLYMYLDKLVRADGFEEPVKVDYERRWLNLPEHQRQYAWAMWASQMGALNPPHSPMHWELMYRTASTMDGTLIQKYMDK